MNKILHSYNRTDFFAADCAYNAVFLVQTEDDNRNLAFKAEICGCHIDNLQIVFHNILCTDAVDFLCVPAIDASAMHSLHELADRAKRKNITLVFSHVNEQPMHVMEKDGFVELIGKENFHENIVDALDYAEQLVK